jgi:6-phosphogluconolactonase
VNRNGKMGCSLLNLLLVFCMGLLLTACGGSGTTTHPQKTLTSIQVAPRSPLVKVGTTQQLTVTGTYSDGSTADVTSSATWASSDSSAASIDSSGKVTAVSVGRPLITATSGDLKGSTRLLVVSSDASIVPRFAFVANIADGTLSAYTVNPSTGQLRHNGYQIVGSSPESVAVEPRGKYVYVTNSDSSSISAFVIDGTGRLTAIAGSPFMDGGNPLSIAIDPTGSFLFTANSGSGNVTAYSVDPATGALSEIPGSPFAAGANPSALVLDAAGKFLFVANQTSNNISAYSIGIDTGALTQVTGSPFTGGTGPSAVAMDPAGKFLFVANSGSANVSVFSITSGTGVLSAAAGSPFATGAGQEISGIAVPPTGKTVYVSNFGSSSISALALGNAGDLTPISGSPFAVDSSPRALQIDRWGSPFPSC